MSPPDDFKSAAARREWEAQERAREARVDDSQDEALVRQYRAIAQALRDPPIDPMPANFAAQTARRVQRSLDVTDDRLERWLQRMFLALLGIAGVASFFYFADGWHKALDFSIGASFIPRSLPINWIASGGLCLIASALFDRWSRRSR